MQNLAPVTGNRALSLLKRGIEVPETKQIIILKHIRDLNTDYAYQRNPVPSSIDEIRRNYKEEAIGVSHICQRVKSKKTNVVDGQNRKIAKESLIQEGRHISPYMLCLLTLNTTAKKEAELFVKLNTSKTVTGNSKFRANLAGDKEPEKTINKWALEEGFQLCFLLPGQRQTLNNGLLEPCHILRAYQNGYVNQIKPSLQLLRKVWGQGRADLVPPIIRVGRVVYALAEFLSYQPNHSITHLCTYFKNVHWDLVKAWSLSKKTHTGWQRIPDLVKRLKLVTNQK